MKRIIIFTSLLMALSCFGGEFSKFVEFNSKEWEEIVIPVDKKKTVILYQHKKKKDIQANMRSGIMIPPYKHKKTDQLERLCKEWPLQMKQLQGKKKGISKIVKRGDQKFCLGTLEKGNKGKNYLQLFSLKPQSKKIYMQQLLTVSSKTTKVAELKKLIGEK